jgi:predicted RNase H-like HicB family nuclease
MVGYPIALEPGTDASAWGVAVPDLPGCFSAGDTREAAVASARAAIEAWISAVVGDGGSVPPPSTIDELRRDDAFAGWDWDVVEIDVAALDQRAGAP